MASIDAWTMALGLTNVLPAIALDATSEDWPITSAEDVLAINMVRIAPWSPSNEAFDTDLQRRNPDWGVRDVEAVTN